MRKLTIVIFISLIAISFLVGSVNALEVIVDKYSLGAGTAGSSYTIGVVHPSVTATASARGQTFRSFFDGANLTVLQVRMWQSAATGNLTAKITGHSGLFGSAGVPNATVYATSASVQVTAGTATVINFTFASGYIFDSAENYCWEIEATSGDVSTEYVDYDNAGLFDHTGNAFVYANGAWAADPAADLPFIIYGTDGTAVAFSEAGNIIIVDQSNLYNVTAGTADVALTVQSPPQDLMFYTLLILTIACIVLMLKSGIPIVNFVFGVMTLGLAAFSLTNTDIIFFGYIQMFAMLMAVLTMLSGYRSWRE